MLAWGMRRSGTAGFGSSPFGDGFTGLVIEARAEPTCSLERAPSPEPMGAVVTVTLSRASGFGPLVTLLFDLTVNNRSTAHSALFRPLVPSCLPSVSFAWSAPRWTVLERTML